MHLFKTISAELIFVSLLLLGNLIEGFSFQGFLVPRRRELIGLGGRARNRGQFETHRHHDQFWLNVYPYF